jgi:hypothetical protein
MHHLIQLSKVKVVLMHAMKALRGNRDIAPRFLNLTTRWM